MKRTILYPLLTLYLLIFSNGQAIASGNDSIRLSLLTCAPVKKYTPCSDIQPSATKSGQRNRCRIQLWTIQLQYSQLHPPFFTR